MNKNLKTLFLLGITLSFFVFSQDTIENRAFKEENQTRSQLLTNSLERMQFLPSVGNEELKDISPWLANAPSLQLSVMKSNESLGSDEYQVSLNLPIKSSQHRRLDKALVASSKQIKYANSTIQSLLLSGLIRESLWGYVLATKQQEIEEKKNLWLKQQRVNVNKLINVGARTVESLLFVDKRLLDSNLLILELKNESAIKLSQYKKLTGTTQLPTNRVEESVQDFEYLITQHPDVKMMKIALEQSNLAFEQSGNASNPLNIAFTARDVETIEFNDKQLGVQFEVPLSFANKKTQLSKSVWLNEQIDISSQMQNYYLILSSQFEALKTEHIFLINKQKLLLEQAELTKKIIARLESLRSNNELEQDIFYQRMIDLHASIHQADLNQIYIYQNLSRQNQLAGVSL